MSDDVDIALRDRFAALADAMFPATEQMPRASTIGIATRLLDRALRVDPRLGEALARLRRPASGLDARRDLRDLGEAEPGTFRVFVLVAAAAYYMAPEVRRALGYNGQEALTIDDMELPEYLEDGTLDRVIARGPIYRDVSGSEDGGE